MSIDLSPSAIVLGIAAMHDRAALRAKEVSRRLVHEECATHLRLLADDLAVITRIVDITGPKVMLHDDDFP